MIGFDSNDRAADNGHNPDALDPLSDALIADAAAWRAEQAGVASGIEQRLAASLRAWRATSDDFHVSALNVVAGDTHDEDVMDHNPNSGTLLQEVEETPSTPASRALPIHSRRQTPRRPPIWVAAALAAVVVIGLIGALTLAHGGLNTTGGHTTKTRPHSTTHLAVSFITPLPVHAATAKDAYNQQVSQVACVTEPAESIETQSVTVTWVYQQPNFGLAFIRAACSNQTSPFAIVNMERDAHGDWNMGSTTTPSFGPQQGGMPAGVALPQDSYYIEVDSSNWSAASGPSSIIGYWVSPTRAYIMTHYSESASRPSGATPLTVNGRAGWVTQSNGMVTVTEPLADGTTIFFSGTGSLAEIEGMAPAALAHANATLPPLDS